MQAVFFIVAAFSQAAVVLWVYRFAFRRGFDCGVRSSGQPNDSAGGGAYYAIDARGASSAEVEQRVSRVIARAHGSANKESI